MNAILRFGAHVSIQGGVQKALIRGNEAGCQVIQIFTGSSRQWRSRKIGPAEVEKWHSARASLPVEPAMAHASYLINIASPSKETWDKSYTALAGELRRCHLLKIPALVLHPGSSLGEPESEAIARIAQALDRLFDEASDLSTRVLLENTAGQGSCIGHRFQHLRDICAKVRHPERLGLCLDTCHMLAAGMEITTREGWQGALDEIDQTLGLDRIQAVHVNDSKKALGSRVDRHEHLGRGFLGLSALRRVVNEPCLAGLPMVLETPKTTEYADAINLAILRNLAGKKRVGSRALRLAAQELTRAPSV